MDFFIASTLPSAMTSGNIAELHSWTLLAVAAALAIGSLVMFSLPEAVLPLLMSGLLVSAYMTAGVAAKKQAFDVEAATKVGDVPTIRVLHSMLVRSAAESWTAIARLPAEGGSDICVAQVVSKAVPGQVSEVQAPAYAAGNEEKSSYFRFHRTELQWIPDQVSASLSSQNPDEVLKLMSECTLALQLSPQPVPAGTSLLVPKPRNLAQVEPEASFAATRTLTEEIRKQAPGRWTELSRTEMSIGSDVCKAGVPGLKGTEMPYGKAAPLNKGEAPVSVTFQFKKQGGNWTALYVSPKVNDLDQAMVKRLVQECVAAVKTDLR